MADANPDLSKKALERLLRVLLDAAIPLALGKVSGWDLPFHLVAEIARPILATKFGKKWIIGVSSRRITHLLRSIRQASQEIIRVRIKLVVVMRLIFLNHDRHLQKSRLRDFFVIQ